jgi:hypothetical protein
MTELREVGSLKVLEIHAVSLLLFRIGCGHTLSPRRGGRANFGKHGRVRSEQFALPGILIYFFQSNFVLYASPVEIVNDSFAYHGAYESCSCNEALPAHVHRSKCCIAHPVHVFEDLSVD